MADGADDGVEVLLTGWGTKEGGAFKTWRHRFFVLRSRLPGENLEKAWKGPQSTSKPALGEADYVLLYFKTTAQAQSATQGPTGVFPVAKDETTVEIAARNGRLCLEITTYGRTLRVMPDGEPEEWTEVLTKFQPDPALRAERRKTLGQNPVKVNEWVEEDDVRVPGAPHADSKPGLTILVDYKPEDAGEVTKNGDTLYIQYTGTIDESSKAGQKGMMFDSSKGRGAFGFVLGEGKVIKGWDIGLASMAPGERRTLIIAPEYAYGSSGAANVIPGGATLRFETELVSINEEPQNPGFEMSQHMKSLESEMLSLIEAGPLKTHQGHVCDDCAAQLSLQQNQYWAIAGPLYAKIDGYGDERLQFDLCECCFEKKAYDEKCKFYVVNSPADTKSPVKWMTTDSAKKYKQAKVVKKTKASIPVNSGLPQAMQTVLKNIVTDPALDNSEKKNLVAQIPEFQSAVEEFRDICIQIFVVEKRFRKKTDEKQRLQGLGSEQLDLWTMTNKWNTDLGVLKDGRSLLKSFLGCKKIARSILESLESAVQRAWDGAWKEYSNGSELSETELDNAIRSVTAPVEESRQPIPDDRFIQAQYLDAGPWSAEQVGAELRIMFEQFVQDTYNGMFGKTFIRYQQAYSRLAQMGSAEQLAALRSTSSEVDKNTSQTVQTILLGLRTPTGIGNGLLVYNLYLSVRARYENVTFPARVKQILESELGDLDSAGLEVRKCAVKGDTRRETKREEYQAEGLPRPWASHIKDLVRLTVATDSIEKMIACGNIIKKAMNVISVKNRLTSSATRDILMIVRLENDFLAEIQIHLQQILDIKRHTHKPYKVDRLEEDKECPCLGGLVDIPQFRAELFTPSTVQILTSYT